MKYYIWIIGCQYNEWDGARLRYFLDKLGFIESDAKQADLILILACSVRQTGIDRILGRVKNWTDKHIIMTGCVLEADRDKFLKKDIELFESGDLKHLFELLTIHSKNRFIDFTVGDFHSLLREQNTQSKYIPIMSGCNNFCSYCAVPYTRGREKSRNIDEVISDAKQLISNGYKEIMLLGQNVNSYKMTDSGFATQVARLPRSSSMQNLSKINTKDKRKDLIKTDFTVLLEKLNALDGDFKILFVSSHPKDMTDDIIEAVASLPKVKKQIHLPLQSGSDKILHEMNRPYTSKQYLDIIEKIKTVGTQIDITTDAIVGFPGETEEDFQETVRLFKKVDFSAAYVNKYSLRAGTSAEKLGDPISLDEKQRRWTILNDIANKRKVH